MKNKLSLRCLSAIAVCSLLNLSTLSVNAQPMPQFNDMMQRPSNSKWHEHMLSQWEKHHQNVKAKLRLTPTQEPAWQAFSAAVRPLEKPEFELIKREDLEKLNTPERIEKMTAAHEARQQAMQAHLKQMSEATLVFYNQLTPEQQKVFDAESLPRPFHRR